MITCTSVDRLADFLNHKFDWEQYAFSSSSINWSMLLPTLLWDKFALLEPVVALKMLPCSSVIDALVYLIRSVSSSRRRHISPLAVVNDTSRNRTKGKKSCNW